MTNLTPEEYVTLDQGLHAASLLCVGSAQSQGGLRRLWGSFPGKKDTGMGCDCGWSLYDGSCSVPILIIAVTQKVVRPLSPCEPLAHITTMGLTQEFCNSEMIPLYVVYPVEDEVVLHNRWYNVELLSAPIWGGIVT